MHILIGILIGLVVATTLIIQWARGNPFVCVFLSIPTGLALLVFLFQNTVTSPDHVTHALICIVILVFVWAPYYELRRRLAQINRTYRRQSFTR